MLLPACTGTGVPVFVMESAAESATCTIVDALLLPRLGSVTLLATDAVSVMVLPEATVVLTIAIKVIVVGVLVARLAKVQVYGETEVHVQPEPANETKVVFAGRVSVTVRPVAVAGPAFKT